MHKYIKSALLMTMGFVALDSFAETAPTHSCNLLSHEQEARLETLLSNMSLEEKVAQMRIFHANAGKRVGPQNQAAIHLTADGQLVVPADLSVRYKAGIAGVKNPGELVAPLEAVKLTNALQREIINASPHKIPGLFVAEAYNGLDAKGTTRFSRPINMAASWNPELVSRAWDVIGREARLRGFHMIHSPVADIHRDPRFGRMSEGFGEDTYLSSAMVGAAVRGVQFGGAQPAQLNERIKALKSTHIGAVVKHLVGYGQVDGGRNFASINISERVLADELLPPFKVGVMESCAQGIMPSHGDINGIASHGNRALLTDLLRGQWGFKGYVVSDAEDVGRLGFFMGVAESDEAAALLGLNAGVDIDLYGDRAYIHLPKLVAQHPEILAQIDEAARRVLRVKFAVGLFDQPYADEKKIEKLNRTAESLELAQALDLESIILLKNNNSLLPLVPGAHKTIALIGPLVEEKTLPAFEKIFGGKSQFIVEQGLELTDHNLEAPQLISAEANKPGFERALAAAKRADVAVVMVGDTEYTAKEAFFRDGFIGDRADLQPVGQQNELVSAIKALGKPVVVVLKHRRTLSITRMAQDADAILDAWELGELGDQAIAKILSGKQSPVGRLPVTVPRHVGQLPIHYSQKRINYKKTYLFEDSSPLFPFGYGLSYTTFAYSDLKLSSPVMRNNQPITASVTVKNTGTRAGKEVVQLYVNDPVAAVIRPAKELKGFQKVELAAGASKTVQFVITPEMLQHTGVDMKPDAGYGAFSIEVAPSAAGGLSAMAEFKQD